jgi:hypothetical protein
MSRAFVLGNGISRLEIDLNYLKTLGPVYGCNAIYREFEPTVLVSTDKPISERIQQEGYALKNKFYTRRPLNGQGAYSIPQEYFGFSSGPIATALAALDKNIAIYMIGFDMGPAESGKFNNVYADTEFYKRCTAIPTYTGNWIRQITTITRDFPKVSFYRIVGKTTAEIDGLKGIKNLWHMPMSDFQNRINNTKEL